MNPHSIEIENLSLGYMDSLRAKREIFPPFSTAADKSQLIALAGRNGVGKSTFLRTLTGLQRIFTGNIYINGKASATLSRKDYADLMSFVSTETVRVMHLKVFDLVAMGRYTYTDLFGSLSVNDEKIIVDSLKMVGMSDFAWRNVSELSDGERQRAMIARALVQDTPIMILDEPTAFLDIPNKYEIILLLKNLTRTKSKTIIFATHDLNIALMLADKIWLMTNGKMYEGTPSELMQTSAFDEMLAGTKLKMENGEIKFK
ncbi:MAG: ABC transporter ATP-binding protein [Prevotellaceae bacterium]|jgi:iron complex transport system ATP-binding protein|nr:ABC transporter ATP-binding protein [Prevotellaceae bacterium]